MLRDISKVLESLADFLEATEAVPESESYEYGDPPKAHDLPLLSDEDLASVPSAFLCPISLCLMVDPVVCEDGHSYDRSSILQHIRARRMVFLPVTSPLTNICISGKLMANHTLRKAIEEWIHTRVPQHKQQQASTAPTVVEAQAVMADHTSIRSMRQEGMGVVATPTATNTDSTSTATNTDIPGGSRGVEAPRSGTTQTVGATHTVTHERTYTAALEPPHAYWGAHTRTSTHTHTPTHTDTPTHTPTHTTITSPSSPIGIHLDDTQVCDLFLWPLRALHRHLQITTTTTTTTHMSSLAPYTLLCVAALFVANLYFAGR